MEIKWNQKLKVNVKIEEKSTLIMSIKAISGSVHTTASSRIDTKNCDACNHPAMIDAKDVMLIVSFLVHKSNQNAKTAHIHSFTPTYLEETPSAEPL
jgi:uncharacterized protein (UPF0179 family)